MNKSGRLSEVEMKVMQVIWAMTEPVTVARLQEILEQKKRLGNLNGGYYAS